MSGSLRKSSRVSETEGGKALGAWDNVRAVREGASVIVHDNPDHCKDPGFYSGRSQ